MVLNCFSCCWLPRLKKSTPSSLQGEAPTEGCPFPRESGSSTGRGGAAGLLVGTGGAALGRCQGACCFWRSARSWRNKGGGGGWREWSVGGGEAPGRRGHRGWSRWLMCQRQNLLVGTGRGLSPAPGSARNGLLLSGWATSHLLRDTGMQGRGVRGSSIPWPGLLVSFLSEDNSFWNGSKIASMSPCTRLLNRHGALAWPLPQT